MIDQNHSLDFDSLGQAREMFIALGMRRTPKQIVESWHGVSYSDSGSRQIVIARKCGKNRFNFHYAAAPKF